MQTTQQSPSPPTSPPPLTPHPATRQDPYILGNYPYSTGTYKPACFWIERAERTGLYNLRLSFWDTPHHPSVWSPSKVRVTSPQPLHLYVITQPNHPYTNLAFVSNNPNLHHNPELPTSFPPSCHGVFLFDPHTTNTSHPSPTTPTIPTSPNPSPNPSPTTPNPSTPSPNHPNHPNVPLDTDLIAKHTNFTNPNNRPITINRVSGLPRKPYGSSHPDHPLHHQASLTQSILTNLKSVFSLFTCSDLHHLHTTHQSGPTLASLTIKSTPNQASSVHRAIRLFTTLPPYSATNPLPHPHTHLPTPKKLRHDGFDNPNELLGPNRTYENLHSDLKTTHQAFSIIYHHISQPLLSSTTQPSTTQPTSPTSQPPTSQPPTSQPPTSQPSTTQPSPLISIPSIRAELLALPLIGRPSPLPSDHQYFIPQYPVFDIPQELDRLSSILSALHIPHIHTNLTTPNLSQNIPI